MAKLTGAKKKAFLERMAKGRKKAARKSTPKRKAKKNPKRKAATKETAKRRKNPRKKTQAKQLRSRQTREMGKALRPHKKRATKKQNPRRRRNGEIEDAAAMYETFHQRAPGNIIETETTVKYRGAFAELGRLKELRFDLDRLNEDFPLTEFGSCTVVCTPDGSNIYFQGGNQAVDIGALGIESDKDMVDLGPCAYICYHTIKGFHDFEPTDYEHEFGEEDGEVPFLAYDRLNKTLCLIGGHYTVKRAGIVN